MCHFIHPPLASRENGVQTQVRLTHTALPQRELGSTERTSEKEVIVLSLLDPSLNSPISKYSVSAHVEMYPVRWIMCFGIEKSRDNETGPM